MVVDFPHTFCKLYIMHVLTVALPQRLHAYYVDVICVLHVGHVSLSCSRFSFKLLHFPNHIIHVTVTGKRVNPGVDMGLEIPVDYFFYGDKRVVDWFKKFIDKLDQTIDKKIGICME